MSGDPSGPIATAIAEATLQAEHLRTDLARRLNPVSTARRLRSEARKASALPLATEQLYALALTASAQARAAAAHPSLAAIARPANPLDQLDLRRQVLRSDGGQGHSDLSAYIFVAEARRIALTGPDPRRLAGWLRVAAGLNRLLWDHPALPVDAPMRRAMLACAPALADRAESHLRTLAGAATPRAAAPSPPPPDAKAPVR